MSIDWSQLDKQSGGGGSVAPVPSAPPVAITAPVTKLDPEVEKLGHMSDIQAAKEQSYNTPLLGGLFRATDAVGGALAGATSWGVGALKDTIANVAGLTSGVGDLNDPAQKHTNDIGEPPPVIKVEDYRPGPQEGLRLVEDLGNAQEDIALQFLKLGQWQLQNSPEDHAAWQKALEDAQNSNKGLGGSGIGSNIGSNAGDILVRYMRDMGSFYGDQTVAGSGDVAPELAFAQSNSLGQAFEDVVGRLMVLQRKAERGAATLPANSFLTGDTDSAGKTRLQTILGHDVKDLTDIERVTRQGMEEHGWTDLHALNYLVSHGQGYSHNPATELALGLALDPIAAGGTWAAEAPLIAARAATYGARSVESANAIARTYTNVAKVIGTTVKTTRDDAILGPIFKVARTVVDPFSAMGHGPQASKKVDVFASAGAEAARKGFGGGGVASASRRAEAWGIRDGFNQSFGVGAMNLARKFVVNDYVSKLVASGHATVRGIVPEETIAALGKVQAKDSVGRMAAYIQRHRRYWLNGADRDQLAERIAKMAPTQSLDDIKRGVAEMTDDERAVFHQTTFSHADAEFLQAKAAAPVEQWGEGAGARLDDLVILNPSSISDIAAQALSAELRAAPGTAERAAIWNAAAEKFSVIEDFGRADGSATNLMERLMNDLDKVISDGGLHTEFTGGVPASFQHSFLDRWVDSAGEQMWRLGFKPRAEQASGLIYNSLYEPIARFEPNISNVADGIRMGSKTPVSDVLGRVLPSAVTDSRLAKGVAHLRDSADVALEAATDAVSGDRLIRSMEQSFVRQMREAGYSDRLAKGLFKVNRKVAQDSNVTLAGLSATDFWKASEETLKGVVDETVAKRDIFAMLAKSAGGDMRLMGISTATAQRIRAAAIARGLDPNNYLGAVTVKAYTAMRYALNPMFFLQTIADAPYYLIANGHMPVGGGVLKPGTELFEMGRVTQAIGHTSLARDLQMDYLDRTILVGFQASVAESLGKMPGVKPGIVRMLTDNLGRMEVNSQLKMIHSKLGDVVFDALTTTRAALEEQVARGGGAEFQRELDQLPMLEHLREEAAGVFGRPVTDEEVGRWYIASLIDDSRLEVRTADGLLNYQAVNAKGAYHVPTDIGELRPLDLDYLGSSVPWPNVHSAEDLRAAIGPGGTRTVGDLRDTMKEMGFHKDHIARATNALTFDAREYFDGLRTNLGMSRFEMQGVEDAIAAEAKMHGMSAHDFLTQVLPSTALDGVDAHVALMLKVMRSAKNLGVEGEKGLQAQRDIAQLVVNNLHPSMKRTILDTFEGALTGERGAIERTQAQANAAKAAGDLVSADEFAFDMKELNQVKESLSGGWTPRDTDAFKDLIIRRASGETSRTFPTVAGHPTAKLVPTDLLDQFMEIDRAAVPVGANIADRDLSTLVEDIRKNGIKDPVIIEYDKSSGSALLTDGNHRLAAARELGITDIPVEVREAKRLPSETDLKKAPEGFKPVGNSPLFSSELDNPEVERAARWFSKYLQESAPELRAGDLLKNVVDGLPVEGASAHNFTQGILMSTLSDGIRTAEKDAIRLAQIGTERTVLDRSLNHPFFALYPTSYMWGKVIPEMFKFFAYKPFGIRTALGAEAYLKVKQTVDMQSMYDDDMRAYWTKFGKSAIVSLLSYISPSMPWEDMKGSLPPWFRSAIKDGPDLSKMTQAEFDTISPERWVKKFLDAAKEAGDIGRSVLPQQQPPAVAALGDIANQAPSATAPTGPTSITGPTKGTDLGPILADDMAELQKVLSQR